MAATEIKVRMQQRRDAASAWTSSNPTLLSGEFGVETDTRKIKLGDGSTAWNSLSYYAAFSITAYPLATIDINDDAVTAAKMADTSVTAGSYTNADITVDAQGRLTAASSGAAAGAGVIVQNVQTINTDFTLTSNYNGVSAGPVAIDTGVTVTVPSGATWVIV